MNKLKRLFFKIHRSKGSFQVHKWEEEEELLSIHVRRCLFTWLSVVIAFQIVRETFLPSMFSLYEPIMLIGFVILYHMARLKGGNVLRGIRIGYMVAPLILLVFSDCRSQLIVLAHEFEVTLSDHGLQLLQIGKQGSAGTAADSLIVGFMLWVMILFYEIGRRQEWMIILIPVLCSTVFYLLLGWRPAWWFFSLLAADVLMFVMPSMAAWGLLSILVITMTFLVHVIRPQQQQQETEAYTRWNHFQYGIERLALAEGDMRKVTKLVKDDTVALEVTSDTKSSYYLKGFTGTVYDGDAAWNNNRVSIRHIEKGILGDLEDIMEYLHGQEMYGDDILTKHRKIQMLKSSNFTVQNVGASRKYLYLPYENRTSISDLIYDDLAINGAAESLLAKGMQGKDYYQCVAVQGLAGRTANIMEEADIRDNMSITKRGSTRSSFGSKKNPKEIYQDYISQVYLSLPKATKDLLAEEMEGLHPGNVSPQGAYSKIKSWMNANIKYTDTPKAIPQGEAFLPWFLKESREGNDAYIASCATMMFRFFGIPARYAEGYLYRPSGNKTQVLQSDAHAWAEIYIDNLGWIPVEFAEPYIDFTASYLPDYQGVIDSDVENDQTDKKDEKESEESTEESIENEAMTTEEAQSEDPEEKGQERKNKDWKKMSISILTLLGKVIGSVLLLFLTLGMGYLIWRLGKHYIAEYRWKRTIQTAVCITEWYRHLMMDLYLLENEKNIPFDDWDNRNTKIEELLIKHDQSFNKKEWAVCMRIYQSALYDTRMMAWKDRKRFVHFVQAERKKLRKQLTRKQRLRLILSPTFN